MMIKIITAMDEGRLIGANGSLPWHCSEDLKHFREKTDGQNVLCGRVTAQSLPELPNRTKFVLSRNCPAELVEKGFTPLRDLSSFSGWVIGGAQVYEAALPLAQEMHITRIPGRHKGDTWFPTVDWREWRLRDMIIKPDCVFDIFIRV